MLDKNSNTRYDIKMIYSKLLKKTLGEDQKDLFISYSWANKTEVHKFCLELEKKGYKLWLDKYGILDEVMQKGIDSSKFFVCCASTDYCKKDKKGKDGNVLREFRYASSNGKEIIFVLFEKYENREEMKDKLNPLWFDLSSMLYYKHHDTDKIINAIEELEKVDKPKEEINATVPETVQIIQVCIYCFM